MVKSWIKKRLDERTSLDGAVLVGVGLVILIAGPFAKLAAYAAIAYGIWTIWKSE
jgi:amino acid permease|tara:strand:- start:265 stop:429 length:165 start_codon:yes stop_codon:yes gene_type:complete